MAYATTKLLNKGLLIEAGKKPFGMLETNQSQGKSDTFMYIIMSFWWII